jgi:hypothetical protein
VTALWIAAALALALGAPGCGEDSDEQFKQDYNQAVRPLTTLGDDVVASLGGAEGQSNRAVARRFRELADRFERTRTNLSRLDPPADTEDEFDGLLASLKESVRDLRAVARAAREGDPAQAAKASKALVETGQRVRRAEEAFQDAVG